ncbi:hypothetical protein PHLGIDRAFT_124624 [Phlebiopsis gigantea 11061_1 CR5-6]|uniref:SMP-LTD domain-containing protein n=1 Tax=Phlebiopsis gigantea (strain 11061_1 CR5-6) TaxID=745531 RepID=A0A0C3P1L8_PHLG1|nr:hypothetical protein PHLGIDRAFT_124624 [Phlebiopsis gigantea 11061_1 CR5-6]
MSFKAIVYAYVLGGLTFIPLVILAVCFYAIYTSVPVGDLDVDKAKRGQLERQSQLAEEGGQNEEDAVAATAPVEVNDAPRTRKGWLTVRRTFEETSNDGSYVGLVKGFLDARSKDPKRSRPKDMWYVVLKGKVLYLYEDEGMTECEAAIELGSHDVVIYPEGLLDGELFAKRNAICLKPKVPLLEDEMPSVTKEMVSTPDYTDKVLEKGGSPKQQQKDKERAQDMEKRYEEAKQEALSPSTPWFIFVRSNFEMEDWYLSLVHASENPPNTSTLAPLKPVFQPADMLHLVETLDEQPDVIPMRWLNALIGRIFFSYYRTQHLEQYIIGRLMRKLSKIKRPGFLTDVSVREVSVGNTAPTLSKPMLKELTKEGDASLEVHLHYKGEVRITLDATATINLGARFKSYTVKLVLAAVLREIEGNLLVKVKRPPSSRIWYAFTQVPRMVLNVEPVVSDRQITWSMILGTIESRLKEVIQESVVLPNMDDISFFESSKFMHRGGIWADASRTERSSELYPSSSDDAQDDVRSTASAPVADSPTPTPTDLDPNAMQRSSSAPAEAQASLEPGSESYDTVPMSRQATISTSSVSSNSSARRRTWFGATREEADGVANQSNKLDVPQEAFERGRSGAPDSIGSRRSSSTPSAPQESLRHDTKPSPDTTEESRHSTPFQRSSSQHSSASSASDAPSQDAPPSTSPAESLLSSLRSKSPAASTSSNRTLPASPTSNFFQTLKTRDKQAISNSAKEAMRKWGVNWGGLKKDSQTTSGDETPDGEMRRQTEERTQKPRPSYAEVRAAVQQRRTSHTPDGARLAPPNVPSEPVDIPGRGKARTTSISSLIGIGGASGPSVGNTSSGSTSPRLDRLTPEPANHTRSTSPSAPGLRQRTTSHHSQAGSDVALSAPVEEEEVPAQPIHTQPAAPKAMIIPGIHASHRGEVMSMGYVPPPPPPTEQKKAPAIQSVYRLWKNPAGQQSSDPQSQPETDMNDQGLATAGPLPPGSSSQTVTPAPSTPATRPVPPPLPPRSNATLAMQLKSEPLRYSPEVDSGSSAAAALQSIVSKDSSRRQSLEPSPGRPADGDPTVTNDSPDPESEPASPPLAAAANGDAPPMKPKPPALPPRRIAVPSS